MNGILEIIKNRVITNSLMFVRKLIQVLAYRSLYTKQSVGQIGRYIQSNVSVNTMFFHLLGRSLFVISQIMALLIFKSKRVLKIEGFDEETSPFLKDEKNIWPIPPCIQEGRLDKPQPGLVQRLKTSYELATKHDPMKLPHSEWWETQSKDFRKIYFDEKGELNEHLLMNFRGVPTIKAALLSEQLQVVSKSYTTSYLKSISLVVDFHKESRWINNVILASVSESFVGNNACTVYRGQRLTRRLIRHAYYLSQIDKLTDFHYDEPINILDLGGGYGGLGRLLNIHYRNSRLFLIEIPEVCVLAGFFLSQCFPQKKVGVLADIDREKLKNGEVDWKEFDIWVLPTWAIAFIPDESIDLVTNTTSLGEMSKEFGTFYLENVERITSRYFYSHNKVECPTYDDFGFHSWNFKKKWTPLHYSHLNPGHREWLGRRC